MKLPGKTHILLFLRKNKVFHFLLIFFIAAELGVCQKPPIDVNALNNWTFVENPGIAANGDYVSYTINNQPVGSSTMVLKSTLSDREWQFRNAGECTFSENGKFARFSIGDSLFFLELETGNTKFIDVATNMRTSQKKRNVWLSYEKPSTPGDLYLFNQLDGFKRKFDSVDKYAFDDLSGNFLVMVRYQLINGKKCEYLEALDLRDQRMHKLWNNSSAENADKTVSYYYFDYSGNHIAYSIAASNNPFQPLQIWRWNSKTLKCDPIVTEKLFKGDTSLSLGSNIQFSRNGKWLFFSIQKPWVSVTPADDPIMVNIWSYKDAMLQPEQSLLPEKKTLTAVVNTTGQLKTLFLNEFERLQTFPDKVSSDYIVVATDYIFQHQFPSWWKWSPQPSIYLVSLKDGSRRLIRKNGFDSILSYNYQFSPSGKYLIYFDLKRESFISYDIDAEKETNITQRIPYSVSDRFSSLNKIGLDMHPVAPIMGWKKNEMELYVYDDYDIWKVDPAGRKNPICITNGYGRRNKIILRSIDDDVIGDRGTVIIDDSNFSLLTGFGERNKQNGFFRVNIETPRDPETLIYSAETFQITPTQSHRYHAGMKPLKATNMNRWVITRENPTDAPNYFLTTDFSKFKRISNVQPQRQYNWLTTELVSLRLPNGTITEGTLFKPENFDSTKRYPVIFHYYETLSPLTYQFVEPQLTMGDMNMPWFVSQGYLVFAPDIHYYYEGTDTSAGESAMTTVIAAASELSKRSYVDSSKMALQGHSFGGSLTNYIISHTSRFTAAVECAGPTDPVTSYLTLLPFYPPGTMIEAYSGQQDIERGHGASGRTIWEHKNRILEISPVLNADNITTPLLMMHNQLDNQIQYRQAVELYMAMRRLGKKVWFLEYDGEGHALWKNKKNRVDFTIRMQQFFDYYMKDSLPPMWMTRGIHAKNKGFAVDYSLDDSGAIP